VAVESSESTVWTVIRGAAQGDTAQRDEFVRRYEPLVRAYLLRRWGGSGLADELDDVVQEIFVDCFKGDGLLSRAEDDRPGGFRAFFLGMVRNHARRCEQAAKKKGVASLPDPDHLQSQEDSFTREFDRDWARNLMKEAAALQTERARAAGPEAVRRVEILRLRFQEDLPIRKLARLWDTEPEKLHREYAKARKEFRAALLEVIAFHHPGTPAERERESLRLLTLLE
jgi:RNA polymerase sigma-70 factor (ECF subfamily)